MSVFTHDVLKTDGTSIMKPDVVMLQDESWKPIYCGDRTSKVKVTSHKNVAGVGLCTVVSADF